MLTLVVACGEIVLRYFIEWTWPIIAVLVLSAVAGIGAKTVRQKKRGPEGPQ